MLGGPRIGEYTGLFSFRQMATESLKVELKLTKVLIASNIKLGFIMYPIL